MSSGINVKVTKLGSRVHELFLANGATVAQALTAAGVTRDGHDIRIGGTPVDVTRVLVDNDTVILVPAIKGGLN